MAAQQSSVEFETQVFEFPISTTFRTGREGPTFLLRITKDSRSQQKTVYYLKSRESEKLNFKPVPPHVLAAYLSPVHWAMLARS